MSLAGKRALITGASRGIGRATAIAFAQAGADVTLVARASSDLDDAHAEVLGAGHTATKHAVDVLDTRSLSGLFDTTPFDILVNNAGSNRPMHMREIAEDDFDAIMDLNVRAAFFVAQAFVRQLKADGRTGAIVNVSSQMGHVGAADRVVYCASKWAIEGMTKAMAVELASDGIRVNAVAPTFVETSLTRARLADPIVRASTLAKIPLGRFATLEEIAAAIVFLASDAAGSITGTSLLVDGGWTAQ